MCCLPLLVDAACALVYGLHYLGSHGTTHGTSHVSFYEIMSLWICHGLSHVSAHGLFYESSYRLSHGVSHGSSHDTQISWNGSWDTTRPMGTTNGTPHGTEPVAWDALRRNVLGVLQPISCVLWDVFSSMGTSHGEKHRKCTVLWGEHVPSERPMERSIGRNSSHWRNSWKVFQTMRCVPWDRTCPMRATHGTWDVPTHYPSHGTYNRRPSLMGRPMGCHMGHIRIRETFFTRAVYLLLWVSCTL